ncbi:secretion system protein [Spongiactinospora gelatinilytica]|uniref:Secretion system protein n=1 Tax=Spongiactinospora gelatinilytica TaxID=2666298 RepID=A0A2W2GB08_9ACTN|nr:type II secretion system F family protein [Spongiactinospora gelatinilytica]PZG45032.1 secretion system protein [Spongiactinospora gelatinilytica]
MAASLLLGAGIGLGVMLIVSGLWPSRRPLALEVARLRHSLPQSRTRLLAARGMPQAPSTDLAVCGKDMARHLTEKGVATLVFALLGPAVYAVLALAGVPMPWQVPVWCMLLLGALGFFVPDLALRSEAARRRAEFRHALSAFLDLVVVSLAGGRGVDGALADAAEQGGGWAFVRIRSTLVAATSARRTPWSALGQIGEEYGIRELSELAASVALAGTEGARVRASLIAKANSIRTHQLAAIETEAQAATERMSVATVGLFVGFLIFTGYPAIAAVLTGF